MKFFLKAFLEDSLTYTLLPHKICQKMIFFSETFWCLVFKKIFDVSLSQKHAGNATVIYVPSCFSNGVKVISLNVLDIPTLRALQIK